MNRCAPFFLLLAATALSSNATAQSTCATATPLQPGLFVVPDITGPDVPSPDCSLNNQLADHGEWYVYTATQDAQVTVSTDLPINSGIDTRIQVYTGTCGNLTCVAGDDDGGAGTLSFLQFAGEQGETYYIAFDDNWDADGFTAQLLLSPLSTSTIGFTTQNISATGSVYALVDMDFDQLDDIVAVSQTNINVLYQQPGGGFSSVNYPTTPADYPASWSLAAGDIDANGHMDLLYGGGSGVTFMKANNDGTGFDEVSFPNYVFSQRSNFVDINNDGHLDAFVCHDVAPNVYFLNDGNGNLTFHQGGLGDTQWGGNYGSIWIDYDNDHDIDLFIAKCGADPVNQLHRNNGDGTFTSVGPLVGLDQNVQTWSCAWADFDLDGDMDVLVGASSGQHKLMRNDGVMGFTDVTAGSGYDTFGATNIEHAAHDFDNDGYVDVFGGGEIIMQNVGNMTFNPVSVSIYNGAVGDMNDDGFLDVLNGNFMRVNNGNTNNYLKVITHGTVSNRNGIGARVEVISALGTQIRDVKSGDGFRYMSSITAHFGLGSDSAVDQVTVFWPSGIVNVVENPPINGTLEIIESVDTDVADLVAPPSLSVHPNPADDRLVVNGSGIASGNEVRIIDLDGRVVSTRRIQDGQVDISSLAGGTYFIEVFTPGSVLKQMFMKR
ncbi:MAG: VCBS repeat-containing protein [Flavobacteriales bacterium]|nr:VCBS repeat-containing protein [Flavobacteriales bacterium]